MRATSVVSEREMMVVVGERTRLRVVYTVAVNQVYGIECYVHSLVSGNRVLASTTLMAPSHPSWAMNELNDLRERIENIVNAV